MSIGALPAWLLLEEDGPAGEPSAVGTLRLLLVLLLLAACLGIACCCCCCCCRSWPSRSCCFQKEGCCCCWLEQLPDLLLMKDTGGWEKLCLPAAACRKPGRGGSSLATTSAACPDSDVGSMLVDSQCDQQQFSWPARWIEIRPGQKKSGDVLVDRFCRLAWRLPQIPTDAG
jgi:hypothetical protein